MAEIPWVAGHSAIRTALQTAVARTVVRLKASADLSAHPPAAAVSLAQAAMGAAVHSDATVAEVAPEAPPAAIRLEVFLVVIPPAVVSQVATVGVAEAVDQSW